MNMGIFGYMKAYGNIIHRYILKGMDIHIYTQHVHIHVYLLMHIYIYT